MQLPRISVAMCVYNGAAYVGQAVESILSQTLGDFEFLIVDDASTDGTRQVLESHRDPRIVVLENERNQGLAASLNRALVAAKGEYIARQDADDVSHPERLAKQVAFLDAHPQIGVVGTTTEEIDAEDRFVRLLDPPTQNADLQSILLRFCCLIHGSTTYRREIALGIGGYDVRFRAGQDYDFWLRLSEAWDMASLPEALYRYRRHNRMTSQKREAEQAQNADAARMRAIQRRLSYGWARAGFARRAPSPLDYLVRRQLAQRYVWWSAGARETSRNVAFQFLLIALLLDPTTPEIWPYIAGILGRKTGLSRLGTPGRDERP